MPLVTIKILDGRTVEQKRGMVKDVTEAIVKNIGCKTEGVTIDIVISLPAGEGRLFVMSTQERPLFSLLYTMIRLQSWVMPIMYNLWLSIGSIRITKLWTVSPNPAVHSLQVTPPSVLLERLCNLA